MFLIGLGATVVLLMPFRPEPVLTPEPLTIGIVASPLGLPIDMAHELGLFHEAGIAPAMQEFANGKQAFEAMLRGEIDVAPVAETPIVLNSFGAHRFTVIAAMGHSYEDNSVVARADRGIRQVRDLRGRRVGVPVGTAAHFFLHALLTDHGLWPSDIVEIPLAGPALASALKSGTVDAVAAFRPYTQDASAAINHADRVVLNSDRVRIAFYYAVPSDLPHRKAESLRRLLSATDRAIAWIRAHPDAALARQVARSGVPLSAAEFATYNYRLSLDQAVLISLEEQARWAISTHHVEADQMPNFLDYLSIGLLKAIKPDAVTVIH